MKQGVNSRRCPGRDWRPNTRRKTTSSTRWYADESRATELADRYELTVDDFIELTGIGAGDYGIYRVTDAGVVLRVAADVRRDRWPTDQQVQLNRAAAALQLAFPCTPAELLAWHERTRGANRAPSDFPLSDTFVRSVRRHLGVDEHSSTPSVPSNDIVCAFEVSGSEPMPTINTLVKQARLQAAHYGYTLRRFTHLDSYRLSSCQTCSWGSPSTTGASRRIGYLVRSASTGSAMTRATLAGKYDARRMHEQGEDSRQCSNSAEYVGRGRECAHAAREGDSV